MEANETPEEIGAWVITVTNSRSCQLRIEHYVVSMHVMPFHICTLNSKKLKERTESYFTLFSKLNDHPARWFSLGLRGIHPKGCKLELNFIKIKSKTKTF